jgi:hypothetical protein
MLLIDKTHEPVVGLDAAESADGFATSSQRLAENHTCTPKVDTHCPYQHQQMLLVERFTPARTFATMLERMPVSDLPVDSTRSGYSRISS